MVKPSVELEAVTRVSLLVLFPPPGAGLSAAPEPVGAGAHGAAVCNVRRPPAGRLQLDAAACAACSLPCSLHICFLDGCLTTRSRRSTVCLAPAAAAAPRQTAAWSCGSKRSTGRWGGAELDVAGMVWTALLSGLQAGQPTRSRVAAWLVFSVPRARPCRRIQNSGHLHSPAAQPASLTQGRHFPFSCSPAWICAPPAANASATSRGSWCRQAVGKQLLIRVLAGLAVGLQSSVAAGASSASSTHSHPAVFLYPHPRASSFFLFLSPLPCHRRYTGRTTASTAPSPPPCWAASLAYSSCACAATRA